MSESPPSGCAGPVALALHQETLSTLRTMGADRLDPVRFHFVETLSKRAQALQGPARRVVDAKLAQAFSELQRRVEQMQEACESHQPEEQDSGPRRPLGELVAYLAQQSKGAEENPGAQEDLKALRYFGDSWAKLRVDQVVTEALSSAPENAGPLNSHLLVLRSLALMRDTSSDYLNRFMTYADTLLWLDQVQNSLAAMKKESPRDEGNKKRKTAKGKTR